MKTSKAINKGDKRINGLKLSCTSVSVGYVSDSLSFCQVKHARNWFSWHFHPLAFLFSTYHEYIMGKCIATTCIKLIKYISTLDVSSAHRTDSWAAIKKNFRFNERRRRKKTTTTNLSCTSQHSLCALFHAVCVRRKPSATNFFLHISLCNLNRMLNSYYFCCKIIEWIGSVLDFLTVYIFLEFKSLYLSFDRTYILAALLNAFCTAQNCNFIKLCWLTSRNRHHKCWCR